MPETYTGKDGGLNKPPESLNKPPESLNKPPESLNKPLESLNKPLEKVETTAQQAFQPSLQTIQTYKDFKHSLSDNARERFLEFCKKEVAGFSRPIINVDDYLAAKSADGEPRYLKFYERFGRTEEGRLARDETLLTALTEQMFSEFEEEFRALECDYVAFANLSLWGSQERELRLKFIDEWDRRNLTNAINSMPILH